MDNVEFENITRLDERTRSVQEKQRALEERLDDVVDMHNDVQRKIAVLESKSSRCVMESKGSACLVADIAELDKRIANLEASNVQSKDRWNRLFTFAIQLAWVILAAWLLSKLNLQPPPIP